MSKFRITPVENQTEWVSLIEKSQQGTVFSHPVFLDALGRKTACYFVYKGGQLKAGVALILTDDGAKCVLDELVIYNGILFLGDPTQKRVKARSERFEITDFVIQELLQRYQRIEMALAPQFEDQRPFLWHNYHSKNSSDKFCVDLRYTSYLNIEELANNKPEEETILFQNLETLRQRNIREARKKNAFVRKGQQVDSFMKFYKSLMSRQNESVEKKKQQQMRDLIFALHENQMCHIYEAYNPQEELIYITIFCIDSKRAYYLFGAGSPDTNERYRGTIAFWDAFKDLAINHNIKCIDLEGVNSPQRGWFKLGLGGDLRTYFKVYK
ncbi:hypothetical protein MHK_002999 [Candidatus Magnetomorum sp. HK-1]|nr:hypothetical protein MHK_002999 [Candidatus Magnetomorum sp. HK-1]